MFGLLKIFCNTVQVKKFRKVIFRGKGQIQKCSKIKPLLEIDFDRINQPIGTLKPIDGLDAITGFWLWVIDFEREEEIGVGPSWPYGELKDGECAIARSIADDHDFEVG